MLIFNIFIGALCGWLIAESAWEAKYAYTVAATIILLLYILQQFCLLGL